MGELQKRLVALKAQWNALGLWARVGVLALLTVVFGAIGWSSFGDTSPRKVVLFSNLGEDDAAHIVARLRTANIPYELGESGTTVLVPEKQVHETRLMLASEGLPNGGGVGFEVFDEQRFGESEFSEQVKYHRALEGELARTISHLSGVKRARVHLVLPTRSLFASAEQGASASIVVHLVPGWKMREDQVKGIVHLVAASVRGLDTEHVTLVDGDGKRLGGGSDSEGEQASDADGFRREVEKSKERAAQQLLDTTLGVGKSIVRVSALLNFTREEVTEERYDKEAVAPRSFQISDERDGANGKTVSGVPGSPSNLPGGQASTAADLGGGGVTRHSETRNFEVSKVLRRAVEPVGRVTGLQVAVVVDGKWSGVGAKRKFDTRPKDEIDRISHIVASAVGLDEKRGDKLVVECVPFVAAASDVITESAFERVIGPYTKYASTLLYVLAAIALLLVIRRMLGRINFAIPGSAGGHPLIQSGAAQALAGNSSQADTLMSAREVLKIPERALAAGAARDDTLEQVRLLASELASHEPEAAARVIRGWLAEGEK